MFFWLHEKSLALGRDGVGDLGLDGKHIWLLRNFSSLLESCWHTSLLARRWCLCGATAGRLQLHKVGKLVIHGSSRCTGHFIFFVSGYCTKTASTPLVEDCICLVCWGLKLNEYHGLVYTTQVNSTFRARWLASSEVISQVLFTSTSVNNC